METQFQVVVETTEFIVQAKNCMDETSRVELINYVAANPESGALISGAGGARKMRWVIDKNSGKRGGVRIVYYYHNKNIPVFLFTVYRKNKRDNLSRSDRNTLKSIIKELVKAYGENSHD